MYKIKKCGISLFSYGRYINLKNKKVHDQLHYYQHPQNVALQTNKNKK